MSNRYRYNNAPPTPDRHRHKFARQFVDWRGVRPEKAPKHEQLSRFNKNLRLDPLKFERATEPENIFQRYDIGNKELPAHKHEQEIIDTMEANKVTVLSGATGSGKTTQVPQMLLKAGYDRVFMLQPRRINADGGDRVEEEIRSAMGDAYPEGLVGVGHSERMTIDPASKVDFLTAGTFLNMLPRIKQEFAGKKIAIIVDETHENGLPTEFASALALQATEAESDWRMAYATATPDSTLKDNVALNGVNGKEVPEIHIEGQPQDIEWSEEPEQDIIETYESQAGDSKKAMMFVEGIPAAHEARRKLLRSMSAEDAQRTKIFILSSKTTKREKEAIKSTALNSNERMVVISTSAGQSGITIPGLDLVILSGITRSPEIDDERADGLPIRLDTQAELKQKGGRTGRDVPGRVILAQPIKDPNANSIADETHGFVPMDKREKDIPPEVYHTSLARNTLMVATMGLNLTEVNDYMKNRISRRSIDESNSVLFNLGALDEDDAITELGKRMYNYSMRPELARAMVHLETNTERTVQIQALAIASAVDNGGVIDRYGSDAWMEVLRPGVKDDFMAQLDLMIESRQFYHKHYVDERELKLRGISPAAALVAHQRFDKMAKLMGVDTTGDFAIEPTTFDQEQQLKDGFLLGMPELIFEHTSSGRKEHYYANTNYQKPIERKLSKYSLLALKMGKTAAGLVVGYPRYFTDRKGNTHNVLEMGFVVNRAQVRRVMANKAMRTRKPEVRGGNLITTGQATIGGVDIGGKETAPLSAVSSHEKDMLAQDALDRNIEPVRLLRQYGVPDVNIFEALVKHAEGASSAHEVGSRIWDMVAEHQVEFVGQN